MTLLHTLTLLSVCWTQQRYVHNTYMPPLRRHFQSIFKLVSTVNKVILVCRIELRSGGACLLATK